MAERGPRRGSPLGREPQAGAHGRSGQSAARRAGKEGPVGTPVDSREPLSQVGRGAPPQGHAAIFTAFAMEAHARAPVEDEIGDPEPDKLGDPGAGVVQRGQHDAISLARPSVGARGVEDRLDLVRGEKPEQRFVEALHRDGEDALQTGEGGRLLPRGKVRKGSNRRKPGIPTANAVVTMPLQMIEKRQDEWGVHVLEFQTFRRFVEMLMGKLQQEPEAIAVRCHRPWTGIPLGEQTVEEERLQHGGQASRRGGRHRTSPSAWRANRCPASARSSGIAVRYQ